MVNELATALENDGAGLKKRLSVRVEVSDGMLMIWPEGHGTCTHIDGEGCPIILTVQDGELKVMLFDDINSEEPKVVDMSGAKECLRDDVPY